MKQEIWRPSPEAVKREAREQDNKDCDLAVQALELAVKHHSADEQVSSNKDVTDTAEWFYRWITSENEPSTIWSHPEDWPD